MRVTLCSRGEGLEIKCRMYKTGVAALGVNPERHVLISWTKFNDGEDLQMLLLGILLTQ